jgi:hypothetical protein
MPKLTQPQPQRTVLRTQPMREQTRPQMRITPVQMPMQVLAVETPAKT